jgi:hypothetical protein
MNIVQEWLFVKYLYFLRNRLSKAFYRMDMKQYSYDIYEKMTGRASS